MTFSENDLKMFVNNIYSSEFKNNHGGMGAPDLFSLWFILHLWKFKMPIIFLELELNENHNVQLNE